MVVGGGRESHTREKGVPFAGGTNLLRMDSLRTCACATVLFLRGARACFSFASRRRNSRKPIYMTQFLFPLSGWSQQYKQNAKYEASANKNQPVLDLVRLRPTTTSRSPTCTSPLTNFPKRTNFPKMLVFRSPFIAIEAPSRLAGTPNAPPAPRTHSRPASAPSRPQTADAREVNTSEVCAPPTVVRVSV